MIDKKRYSIKVGGESGQGINVTGEILGESFKDSGYKVFAYREYPSLIKGGFSSYQIDFSNANINSSSRYCNILVCVSRRSVHEYLRDVAKGGILIHSITALQLDEEEQKFVEDNDIEVIYIKAFDMAVEIGGNRLFSNVIMAGIVWKIFGLDYKVLEEVVKKKFADKPKLLEKDLEALKIGYEFKKEDGKIPSIKIGFSTNKAWKDSLILTGNQATAVGALCSGVRAMYSYPMTPATSIHGFLSETYHETGILMKEAEDEMTAMQLTIGSMFTGTRALVATSGGGFDLMAESISLIGITETPVVAVLAQRPGPATGLPTWTGQGDLDLAVHIGHGEFPRIVIAASDASTAYELIQKAFNLAEKYQTLVILLTEKQICESLFNIKDFAKPLKVTRNLLSVAQLKDVKPSDRYKLTESGISDRWLPGQSDSDFLANSDEHLEDGTSTEDADAAAAMIEKRMRKMDGILSELPEPTIHGSKNADYSFIGWGSTRNTMLDVIDILKKSNVSVNYLHFDYIYPLKVSTLHNFAKNAKRLVLIEGNFQGQLGRLIRREAGIEIKERLLKYNGRPFFIEDVLEYLKVQ